MRPFALIATLILIAPVFAVAPDTHWSLRPRTQPVVPELRNPKFAIRTPVDAFILARLEKEGLTPAPEADRATLIRRVTLDLIGLPPTPAEVDAFVKDPATDAYEKLVERLLASPHHGEKWGRHWLDLVRYSETEGFEYDRQRSGAWRYRDYVIDAFNRDKPYDRFVLEQLAGDELNPSSDELQIAAGFNRLGPVRRNAGNQELAFSRNEVLTEMADATGTVFLGLTVACARCHDHKFDGIAIDDYYSFQAFWASSHEHDNVQAGFIERAVWNAKTDKIQGEIKTLHKSMAGLTGDAREQAGVKLKGLEASLPPPLPALSTIRNVASDRTPVHVLRRGNIDKKGQQVGPKLLGIGFPGEIAELPVDTATPRTILARAIVQPENPLAARVMVNRVWQWHFGTGIVDTANDFGVNGGRPSHPELLDWLANEFVAGGWHIKQLHRLIVLSSTYRQASKHLDPKPCVRLDPSDRLLWQFPRRRLTAEEVRDSMLMFAGRLNLKARGPSVVVPVDNDLVKLLYTPSQWVVTPDRKEHDRRSVYLHAKRNLRLPFMEAFDQPDAATSCSRRESSTHALQSLELLNGTLANDLAESFAGRLHHDAGTEPSAQIELAYRLAAGRSPSAKEKELAVAFLKTQSLKEFALAVFNLNAFLYVN
ncbi:MAG: DUF1549 and DUF1553 domain-containing protein [Planctomycetes bacterium]|nr:DUF1549 and DUF1553 domain-containing protein [Planctomycetota bacterium]